jgi:bacterioferritin
MTLETKTINATDAAPSTNRQVISALQKAYSMELEAVANYIACSVNPNGVVAEEIKRALSSDVTEELGHAQRLAARIKQLGGVVPASSDLAFGQSHLARTEQTEEIESVVRGVIADEAEACQHYRQIVEFTDGRDAVTQDLCTQLLADEEEHHAKFVEFLTEFEA